MTARSLSAAMLTEIQATQVRPVILYEGIYEGGSPSEYLRLWTGVGDLSWDSETWTGAGHLMGFSAITETTAVNAVGFTVTLSGMPSDILAVVLGYIAQGHPGRVWLGAIDSDGALIADPYLLQDGKLDTATIQDSGTECSITVTYESRLVDLLKPRTRRYTPEDRKLDYPTDKGFEYVPQLQDKLLIWGGPVPPQPAPAQQSASAQPPEGTLAEVQAGGADTFGPGGTQVYQDGTAWRWIDYGDGGAWYPVDESSD